MSKDIKKALEHCIEWNCADCPNREELGSGDIVCRARLLPEILEYISDLQHKLEVAEKALELACNEELRSFGEYDEDYGYEKQFQMLKDQYKEQAEKEVKGEETI